MWYELVKTNWKPEMVMLLCNMRSLRIAGRVIFTQECGETKKSKWFKFGRSELVMSLYDMCSLGTAGRVISL